MTFRFSAQVACGLFALSVGLAACSQADCALLAGATLELAVRDELVDDLQQSSFC